MRTYVRQYRFGYIFAPIGGAEKNSCKKRKILLTDIIKNDIMIAN